MDSRQPEAEAETEATKPPRGMQRAEPGSRIKSWVHPSSCSMSPGRLRTIVYQAIVSVRVTPYIQPGIFGWNGPSFLSANTERNTQMSCTDAVATDSPRYPISRLDTTKTGMWQRAGSFCRRPTPPIEKMRKGTNGRREGGRGGGEERQNKSRFALLARFRRRDVELFGAGGCYREAPEHAAAGQEQRRRPTPHAI